jgi:hypothetical protein
MCCLLLCKEVTPAAFQVPGDICQPLSLILQGCSLLLQGRSLVLQRHTYSHTPLRSTESGPQKTGIVECMGAH